MRKEKSSQLALDFSPMISTPVVFTSGSEPESTADGDVALTSTLSVSTVTTKTKVSTSTTAPTTSQVANENPLLMIEKPIAFLGDIITTFIESQKRASSSSSSGQRHQSRSRHKDHYSYYTRSCSQSPRKFKKVAGVIMVICIVVDHLPQTSYLMTRNQKLTTGMGSTPSIGIKMMRMSNRVMETMRMWVTYLIGTSKQLCQCLLQWVQTLQNQICWVKKTMKTWF